MMMMMMKSIGWGGCLVLLALFWSSTVASSASHESTKSIDLRKGFTLVPLEASNFDIQSPYDLPRDQRYSFIDGVHKLRVFSTDKPASKNSSNTAPRTEIRMRGHDYSTGVWQFEAFGYVPSGTSGACIMQVFGSSTQATTLMLDVFNGSLTYYRHHVIIPNICDRWFQLNVIHDVDASKVQVYINGTLKHEAPGHGGNSHFFKCGVYAQHPRSHYMESRWKDIKIFKKAD